MSGSWDETGGSGWDHGAFVCMGPTCLRAALPTVLAGSCLSSGAVGTVRGVMETDVTGGTDPLAARPRTYRCTAEEHATILELARVARMKVSGYLIACALNEGGPAGESLRVAPHEERRALLDRVRRIDECLGTLAKPLPGTDWSMFDGLAFLGRARRVESPGSGRWGRPGGVGRTAPQGKYSLSCTDRQWQRVKSRAGRQGMSTSRFLVACGLAGAPDPVSGELYQRVQRIEDRIVGRDFDVEPLAEQTRKAVAFLVVATMERMIREGRAGEILAIAGELFDAETLARTRTWVARHASTTAQLP